MRKLLSSLSEAVARWDAARSLPLYRLGGVFVGLSAALIVLAAPTPEGLPAAGQRVAAVAALMGIWWLGGVLPIAVTALVPLVALPILGITSMKAAAAPFAHPLIFLMLGGFLLSHAMEEVGLHRRVTALLLQPAWVRARPQRVVLALMVAGAALSGLVSNTATTLMMLPIAMQLASLCADDRRTRSGFVLALAYACSIGGVTTLVGTPPNAVLAAMAQEAAGVEISFASWMMVGVPFAVLAVPLAWLVITRVALPLPDSAWSLEAPDRPAWMPGERVVLAVVGLAMVLWLTRKPIAVGAMSLFGWSTLLPEGAAVDDAWVAVLAGLLLFLVPGGPPGEGSEARFLLSFRRAEEAIPWSVLLLLGGGFSLAGAISSSGLTAWLAGSVAALGGLPTWGQVGAIALGMTFLTELTSNTATSQICLPLLAAGAAAAGVEPLLWMIPATISASCAFMMPVATAPNAIAAEAGGVAPGDMAFAGVLLNLLCALLTTALALVLVPLVF